MSISAMNSFQAIQYQFTRHIRDPEHAPAPQDIEARRMAIYRDLLFRNVAGFLAGSFPVVRKILKDSEWHDLIRDYFRNHQARTPLFPKMPQEFLQYLQNARQTVENEETVAKLYPFLTELAHYEWVELALSLDVREIREQGLDPAGDLLSGVPVLNELSWSLAYHYPVHRIGPDYLPEEKPAQPTCLFVYRDRADQVRFIELNPLAARLVDCLKENEDNKTGRDILTGMAAEIAHPDPEVVIKGGSALLEDMREKEVILGVR
ncbi:MAG: putative DNA-binding domain-containing protein [Gammaproteobacteria bacterium]|nr:putative DNA-binding domain-containing protein [Gammaproteobacteria bacterium]